MGKLICKDCAQTYRLDEPYWKCKCGGLLDIEYEAVFDLGRIQGRRPTMWRYREALPLAYDENILSFGEGFTPLVPVNIHGRTVLVKQDQLFLADT